VAAFLAGNVLFTEIVEITEGVLQEHVSEGADELHAVLEADAWARRTAEEAIRKRSKVAAI
jgi:1-deoxy-D-xylulose 5-phosphate reductoisomerase